jgi:hypothetical protein
MRSLPLVVPAAFVLSAISIASQDLVSGWQPLVVSTAAADTGDSATGRSAHRRAALECPMPVLRPDSGAALVMPAQRGQSTPSSTVVAAETPTRISDMPVVRANCWNPLDRPRGERDSVVIDANPQE